MRLSIITCTIGLFTATPGFADTCSELFAAIPKLHGSEPLMASAVGKTYKALYDECDAHDQFAGHRPPTHNGKGLTCSGDRNRIDYLVKYPDSTISFSAKASVDADGSKFACGDAWPNQCATWLTFDQGSERNDVNAEDTPFVVVPTPMASTGISFQHDTQIGKGDLAVAFWNGKCSFGVVGDAGPYFRLGEISLRSHADLGHPRCKKPGQYPCAAINDVSIPKGVQYLVFPHSRPSPLTSENVNQVSRSEAEKRVNEFIKKFAQ
ncbi:MAG TPA: glycoside hydrolase family 75 protein [Methylobacter sp.]